MRDSMTWLRSKRRLLQWALVVVLLALVGAGIYSGIAAFSYPDLVAQLRAASATVAVMPGSPGNFFKGAGHLIAINGETVQVYEYLLPLAADLDASHISSDCSTSHFFGGETVDWIATPHCYKRGKVIATYIGDSKAMTRLLASILGTQFAGG